MTKISFRSRFEEDVYNTAVRNKKKLEYEPYALPYVLHSNYLVDMVLPNGIHIETKGRLTATDRRKMLAVKSCNPGIDIRFVFQRASNKLTKKSKMTYAQWAERSGFKYAEGHIPLEWWREKIID